MSPSEIPESLTRTLQVDGLVNARDLGGLRRRNGSVTPSGVFYRSENVDWIHPTGSEQLRTAGIRTIVDLRQPGERVHDTSPRPQWIATIEVDLDGLENEEFWTGYRENRLIATALCYLPHLDAMPERAGAALSAIVNAPPGGVLFHCMGGRDRTGMIALLLLTASNTEMDAIVDDYLETVRLGGLRAATSNRNTSEAELEEICRIHGTTTEGAFRAVIANLDLEKVLSAAGMSSRDREAQMNWRGSISAD